MPQFTTQISADGVEDYTVHFVLEEGVGPDPLPLVFTHGWPGSFFEVSKILGPLTDPGAHGGGSGRCVYGCCTVSAGIRVLGDTEQRGIRAYAGGSHVGGADVGAWLRALRRPGR